MQHYSKKSILSLALLLPSSVFSTPFGSYDARTMAMGNAGVAAANLSSAAFYNPAMLALQESNKKKFHITLPILAINIADQQNVIDDLKNYQAAPSNSLQRTEIAKQMLNKPFFAEIQLGTVVAFKTKSYSLAINYNRHIGASIKTSASDLVTYLDTKLNVIGLDSQELGFTLAKSFHNNQNRFSVGINPKLVSVTPFSSSTLATSVNASNLDFINIDSSQNKQEFISLDLGFAYQMGAQFRAGFSLRDLISQRYVTAEGERIRSTPKARIGVAYEGRFYTVAADYDLSNNDPIAFESSSRFFSLGTELRFYKIAKMRLGYLHNSADSSNPVQMFSLGAGLNLFGAALDLTVVSNQKKVLSGAVQTGFSF
ncbi:MAG: conjugal transfer protein TraF [Gammaproteobacteria bacterium]|nr:conjugal transfer protein TraF [Gammaproteobacteria bacterium]